MQLDAEVLEALMIEAFDEIELTELETFVLYFRLHLDFDGEWKGALRPPEEIVSLLASHHKRGVSLEDVIRLCDKLESRISEFVWSTVNKILRDHFTLSSD